MRHKWIILLNICLLYTLGAVTAQTVTIYAGWLRGPICCRAKNFFLWRLFNGSLQKGCGMKLAAHFHPVPGLRLVGILPSLIHHFGLSHHTNHIKTTVSFPICFPCFVIKGRRHMRPPYLSVYPPPPLC